MDKKIPVFRLQQAFVFVGKIYVLVALVSVLLGDMDTKVDDAL
jgi:hypothetical protein